MILAGGYGSRLWPLSRQKTPKQFIDFFGEGSLLKQTIQRLDGVVDPEHILVVGCQDQSATMLRETRGLIPPANLLMEPTGRNTTACIAFLAAHLESKPDAVLCILPSDHYIADVEAFRAVIRRAMDAAERTDHIVTVGIQPTFAATGFGYLRASGPVAGEDGAYYVERFIEKPDEQRARRYVEQGCYYWNGGMFIAKRSVLEREMMAHLPHMLDDARRAYRAQQDGYPHRALRIYASLPSLSIDYGVMEKSDTLIVIPGDFGWSDVGSFDALYTIAPQDEDGNAVLNGRCMSIDAHSLAVYTNKPVVALGVENLVVIDTEDVLFLCKMGQAQRTKDVLGMLRVSGLGDLM